MELFISFNLFPNSPIFEVKLSIESIIPVKFELMSLSELTINF